MLKKHILGNIIVFKHKKPNKTMNRLKRSAINLGFLVTLAISGCGDLLTVGGRDYKCLYKSRYADSHIKKAEEIEEKLRRNPNLEDKKQAVHAHGSLGNLRLMDKYVNEIINEAKVSTGDLYSWIGEQYYKTHEECKHEMDSLK